MPYVIGRGALDELVPVAGVAAQVEALPSSPRRRDPGHVTYSWYPDLTPAGDGIGATGAYWPGDLRARSAGPGELSTVDARSLANPDPGVTVRRGPLSVHTDPLPAGRYGSTWDEEARPAASPCCCWS